MKKILVAMLFVSMFGLVGCNNDGGVNVEIPGVTGPTVTLNGEHVLINMNFDNLVMEGEITIPVPQYADSSVTIKANPNGGAMMTVKVSAADLLDDSLQELDPQALPGGRALPGIAAGSLPAVAFTLPDFYNMSVYIGPDVFGFFVPVENLGTQGAIASFRYYIGDKASGTISLVGTDNAGDNAGILLLLNIDIATKSFLRGMLD